MLREASAILNGNNDSMIDVVDEEDGMKFCPPTANIMSSNIKHHVLSLEEKRHR